MSDLLNKASLVMVPSGYKEDTVYSVVPTDGSGDLTFTRASNGTRVNSAGLVEVCPWNLCTYSEQFQNADWSGGGLGKPTMTDNFAEAPNGTMTASKMEAVSDQYQIRQNNAQENTQMNLSVWLRTNTGTKTIQLFLNNGNTASQNITVTTTWTRYEISGLVTTLSGSGRNGLVTLEALTSSNYILVWGFQLSVGLTAKPYFPTTDRLNVPRLTYQNGGGGCPSLLLEKQSTNLLSWSEDFTKSDWTKQSGVSVTANQTISPDGTQNADLVVGDGTSGVYQSTKIVSTTVANTKSVWLKGVSGGEVVKLQDPNQTVGFTSCTLTTSWQRFTLSELQNLGYAGLWVTNIPSGGIYMWGAQLEDSSYATSYIPTTSSSATRVADVVGSKSLSSVGITSNYTLFFQLGECNLSAASTWILQGSSGANTPFQIYGTTAILYTSTGYIYPFSFVSTNPNNSKVAVSYNGTNIKVFLDGVKVGQWTSSSEWANLNDLHLTYNSTQQLQYKQVVLFNVGLSDADGIALTTI